MLLLNASNVGEKSPIVVSFYVPERGFVTARGDVIYIKPPKEGRPVPAYGVKFSALQFHERRFIRDYIADKTVVETAVD